MNILITEEQYNILLAEADKRSVIVNVLKLNQQWADEFHSMHDKLSIWVASTFIDEMVRELNKTKDEVVSLLNQRGPRMHEWSGVYKTNYLYIFDWLRAQQGRVNARDLNYQQAMDQAREWHDSLTTSVQLNYQETGEIFIDYRDRRGVGFYWAHLHKSSCSDEQSRMGHCGRASHGQLISLRGIDQDGNGESYVTADYDNGMIYDFHSRGNSKPPERYHRYIMDFLVNTTYPVNGLSKTGVYSYATNFHLSDLTEEQRRWVFERNGSLRFNINDETTWPEIIEAIKSGEIDPGQYSIVIALGLIKRSGYDQELISKFSSYFGDPQKLIDIFLNNSDFDSAPDQSKKVFAGVFGTSLISALNNNFDRAFSDIDSFQKFLRKISMQYLDTYEVFCPIIDKGFKKWADNIPELVSTPRIRKKILRCTDAVDMLNQYADFTAFDANGHALVRMDDEDSHWGVVDRTNRLILDPDYVALSYSPMDRNLNILIGKKRDGKFYKINLETGETKALAGR